MGDAESSVKAPWNSYHEKLLKRWSQICKTYAIMHSLSAQYFSKWHKRLGIPVVLLGGITASSIFSSTSEDSRLWVYINGSLSLLTTALTGLSGFLGTAEQTNKHQIASFKYTKISMDIDSLLSFPHEYREKDPSTFLQQKNQEMMEIRENFPEVLAWIMNHYLRRFDASLVNTSSSVNRASSRPYLDLKGTIDHPDRPLTFLSPLSDRESTGGSGELEGGRWKALKRVLSGNGEKLRKAEREHDARVYSASLQLRRERSSSEIPSVYVEIPEERVDLPVSSGAGAGAGPSGTIQIQHQSVC